MLHKARKRKDDWRHTPLSLSNFWQEDKRGECVLNFWGGSKRTGVFIASNIDYLYDEKDHSGGVVGPIVEGDDGGAVGVE